MFAGMTNRKQEVNRFRAKASRRPLLFWWQAFAILGITIFLWSGLSVGAVFYNTRKFIPLPEPRAAYVVLEPAEALSMLRKARSDWMLGNGDALSPSFTMDLGLNELRERLPQPSFLETGISSAKGWSPAAVEALPQRLSAVPAPSVFRETRDPVRHDPPSDAQLLPDSSLAELSFTADLDAGKITGQEGYARFYVETGRDGRVEHVLAMPPVATGASVIERALLRGRAQGAARGFVEVYWKAAR